jgi:hypothetical protein
LPTGLETELSADTASTLVAIARQYLAGLHSDPPEHLALELAIIADDEALPESVRREARAVLAEVAL